jgi:hypothetical protein
MRLQKEVYVVTEIKPRSKEASGLEESWYGKWTRRFLGTIGLVDKGGWIIRLHERLLALQAREHCEQEHPYYDVTRDRMSHLKQMIKANPLLISSVDAVGGNIIHIAYLHEHYKLGQYLVECYPEVALKGYSEVSSYKGVSERNMPYTGVRAQNIHYTTILLCL